MSSAQASMAVATRWFDARLTTLDWQTYASQWNWDSDHVIITAAAIADVVASGQDAVFAFEFYPRVAGNAANFTVTV